MTAATALSLKVVVAVICALPTALADCPRDVLAGPHCEPCRDGYEPDPLQLRCEPCSEDSAGMRGRCERCGELMEPNADRTLCVRSTLFWVLAIGSILGLPMLEWLRRKYNECVERVRARSYKRHTDEIELDIESGREYEYDCFLTHDWGVDENERRLARRRSRRGRLWAASSRSSP